MILATPIPVEFDPDDGRAQIRGDCLVAIGRFGSEYLRLVITALEYDKDMTARITAVPEAPQLWQ